MTKRPFSAKYNKSKGVLKLVHTDVCGPLNLRVRRDFEYFITFINNYLRHGDVYLLHYNSKVFEKFKKFWAKVEKQLDKNIKSL